MQNIPIYVGYDTREDVAWQVAKHSAMRRISKAKVIPLKLTVLTE